MRFTSPDVQFQIGEKSLTLRMSAKAWAALQDHWQLENLDLAVSKLAEMEAGTLHARDLGAIMWAALRTHHSELSIDDAFEVLDDLGIPGFMSLVIQCAAAAVPEGGGKASANPPRWPWSRGR